MGDRIEEEHREEPIAPTINLNQLQYEAMMAEVTRRVRETLNRTDHANDFLPRNVPVVDRITEAARMRARRMARQRTEEEQAYASGDSEVDPQEEEDNRFHHQRPRAEDNLGNLKLRVPPFLGKNDPDAYLEWEKKMEMLFSCQHYSEEKKVKLAATEFSGYALNWWNQIAITRRRSGEPQITSWFEMKAVMKKRFVPPHYGRDLHQRLRRLTQGTRSVEDYHQEMETLLIKAEIFETPEATMARFQGGLNRDLQDRLELQEYEDMDELLHKSILIEQQLKRRSNTRNYFGASSKPPYSRDNKTTNQPKGETSSTPPPRDDKGKGVSTPTRARNVKCFKCQGFGHYANECTNRKVMIIMDNGEVISEDEKSEQGSEDEGEEYPAQGELLVTRRTLSTLHKTPEQEQRENLFHTRCLVYNRVCSLIIDGGSCTNVASQVMVEKLNLTIQKHPRPYSLQWLNEEGELRVTHQVKVPLTIGRYQDEITCDILPMEASHILLGRPWQYDKQAIHDGFTNRHTFTHEKKKNHVGTSIST